MAWKRSKYNRFFGDNGRPTLVLRALCTGDAVEYGGQGIEVKANRNMGHYQGHDIAAGWLMVLHYALDDTTEPVYERNPMRVVSVVFAKFQVTDWGLGHDASSPGVAARLASAQSAGERAVAGRQRRR